MHCSFGRCGSPILDGEWALLAGQKRIPSEASRIHALNCGVTSTGAANYCRLARAHGEEVYAAEYFPVVMTHQWAKITST